MTTSYSLDLSRLQRAYASGALTPGAVVRDVYGTISAAQTQGNPLWIHLQPHEAVAAQAREIEARRAAGETLPLYGVPFAVKDNIDVAGVPTTAACPAFAYVPQATAPAVERLQQAGALLIGKTNLDQFATGLVGTRSPYGACFNPFDRRYIAGGSSSGSALAVAIGCVSFALGTDTAGSGRVPAAFTNTVGLKPTRGLVSTRGVVPACRSLDCVSIFALTCEDALRVFEQARGYDPEDIYARNAEPAPATSAARPRCGVPRASQLEFFGDEAARAAFGGALRMLEESGAQLVEVDFEPFLDAARLLYEGPWIAERYAALKDFLESHAHDAHPVTREIIMEARKWSAADAFEAHYRLEALRRHCGLEWARMDLLAVPSTGTIYTVEEVMAAPVERNANLGRYTNFVNLLDLAAIAVPAGFRADGLPASVTLIAPALRERELAGFGARLHRAAGVPLGATGHPLPPPASPPAAGARDEVLLAVAGAHLSGMPLNGELTARGARLVEATTTAARYRLYALPGTTPPKPALVRVANGPAAAIEVELWTVPAGEFGGFVAAVPPPLGIGTVTLRDGREVKGFVCESYALASARDISEFGGWRAFCRAAVLNPATSTSRRPV
jgi:allophanate hydrolase